MLPVALIAIRARLAPLVLVPALSLGLLRSAAAEESRTPAGPAQLQVEGSSPCATRSELVARVQARSPRARFVNVGGAIAISVRFSAAPAGATVADVAFTSADAKSAARRVQARTCGEATDAVALIIAMALGGPGNRGDASGETVVSASTESGSASTSPKTRTASGKAPAPARNAEGEGQVSNSGRPALPGPGNAGSVGMLVAAQSFFGPAPQIMPGIGVYALLSLERPRLWSPAILLGATHAWQSSAQQQGGKASFTLDAATLDACPIRLRLGVIQARPCGSVLAGRFSARGFDTIDPGPQSRRPFWVLGAAAVVSADMLWLFEASARVALGANLVRDSFEFTPSVFHTVPAVSASGSVGVGMRWR